MQINIHTFIFALFSVSISAEKEDNNAIMKQAWGREPKFLRGMSDGRRGLLAPSNDDCSTAKLIPKSNFGFNQGGSLVEAHGETGLPSCVANYDGSNGVWFRVEGTGCPLEAHTNYFPSNTIIKVFSGSCGGLDCVASNNNDPNIGSANTQSSRPRWNTRQGQDYFVFVFGAQTSNGIFRLVIEEKCPMAPSNDECSTAQLIPKSLFGRNQEGSLVKATGETGLPSCVPNYDGSNGVWFRVEGTGCPLEADTYDFPSNTIFQVFSGFCGGLDCVATNNDDPNIVSANTQSSRVRWNTQQGQDYFVFVFGAQTSYGIYKLRIIETCPPANDNVCFAEPMPISTWKSFTTVHATADVGEVAGIATASEPVQPGHAIDNDVQNSVWFEFSPGKDMCIDTNLIGNQGASTELETQLALWQADSCSDFTTFTQVAPNTLTARLSNVRVHAGERYYLQVDGYLGIQTSGQIMIEVAKPTVQCIPYSNPETGSSNDGYFQLVGSDECSDLAITVQDSVSGQAFGPFPSGTVIKYVKKC